LVKRHERKIVKLRHILHIAWNIFSRS